MDWGQISIQSLKKSTYRQYKFDTTKEHVFICIVINSLFIAKHFWGNFRIHLELWWPPNERNELVVIQTPHSLTPCWLHFVCHLQLTTQQKVPEDETWSWWGIIIDKKKKTQGKVSKNEDAILVTYNCKKLIVTQGKILRDEVPLLTYNTGVR